MARSILASRVYWRLACLLFTRLGPVRTGDCGDGLNRQYHYRAPCSVGKGMENLVESSTTGLARDMH